MKKRKVAVFDIDGTLFRWQLFHELAHDLIDEFGDTNTNSTVKANFNGWKKREATWSDYEMSLLEAFTSLRPQISEAEFDRAAERIIYRSRQYAYRYTRELARTLKNKGYFLLAITGSDQEVAEPFCKHHNFDSCIGALYERKNGYMTAKQIRRTIGRKAEILRESVEKHDLTLEGSVGVGDSESDIEFLKLVDRPIAFNPTEGLLGVAKENNWEIVVERKNIAYSMKKGANDTFILADTRSY